MSQINVGTVNASVGVQLNPYTSASRPAGSNGLLIYNSDLGQPEIYTGGAWSTVGGSDPDIIGTGTTANRPTTDLTSRLRWNTDNHVLETYLDHNNGNSNAAWHAVGGKQLIARCTRNDAWSSVDILWGGVAGRNTKYYAYEIVLNYFEPSDANRTYYARLIDGNGTADTGNTYFWSMYWQHANDGVTRHNSGTGGTTYLPISTANNASYELLSNGEASYGAILYLTNTPSDATSNYWSWWLHSGGSSEQGGGFHLGGGAWRNATRIGGNAYPCNGIRVYTNNTQRAVTSGVNLVVSVFGIAGHEGQELGYPTVG